MSIIPKALHNLFHGRSDKKHLAAYQAEFLMFSQQLVALRKRAVTEPMEALVEYFDLASYWEDKDLEKLLKLLNFRKNGENAAELVKDFNDLISSSRQPFGWNRTKTGEKVTQDKVYLGNIWGLFTKPVSYWLQVKDAPKGGWGWQNSTKKWDELNAYDVILQDQVRPFLNGHLRTLIQLSDQIACELDKI